MKQAFLRSQQARNAPARNHLAMKGSRTRHLLHLYHFHWQTLAIRCQSVWMIMRDGFDSDHQDAANARTSEDVARAAGVIHMAGSTSTEPRQELQALYVWQPRHHLFRGYIECDWETNKNICKHIRPSTTPFKQCLKQALPEK